MENNNGYLPGEEMEIKIWEYIDNILSASEHNFIKGKIEQDAAWRVKYQELLNVNSSLQDFKLDAPSMRFSKNVMEEIARTHISPATSSYLNKKIIWSIGAIFIIMLIGSIIFAFAQTDWSGPSGTDIPIKIPTYDFSRLFSSTYVNVFMMINIVLGLFLIDRVLAGKREAYRRM